MKVAVVGGGVVGLTTALLVQEENPNIQVTVIAEKFSPDTTSDVAAGIFSWKMGVVPGSDPWLWPNQAWSWYKTLLKENRPDVTGVSNLPVLYFSQYAAELVENPVMEKLCNVYRRMNERELNLAQPAGKFKHGVYFHTMQIDTGLYLKYLTDRFIAAGGQLVQGKVSSLTEVDADVVVNCAGLGARWLANDKSVLPLRGQVLQVEAPWIKTCLYADDVYIIPGQRYVTVGGLRQYNEWMTEEEPHDSARIWSRALRTFPTLAGAKILGAKVGLRPHRKCPRVERETIGSKAIVHNYGHCGYGIMASPATSIQAAGLVREAMAEIKKAKL